MGAQTRKKIPLAFYQEEDTVETAKALLGKSLFTCFNGELTGGVIIETEAYLGAEDKACHAYNNRRTKRTEVMFSPGGVAYVYLCYGMHHLFNIVINKEGNPHAILIRALKPTHGLEIMQKRRGRPNLTDGPATLTQALGIRTNHTGLALDSDDIWLEDNQKEIPLSIEATPRIGIDYAEEHKDLPYRFVIAN